MLSTMSNQVQSNAPLPLLVFIPDELIAEILSFLDVKTILRLKCVSKSWKSLISDPIFIQKHLKKSSQNPHLIITPSSPKYPINSVKTFPVRHLLNNPFTVSRYNSYIESMYKSINSCNGLLCLLLNSRKRKNCYCFCIWNPATRKISEEFGTLDKLQYSSFEFTFGCDILTGTYKIVTLYEKQIRVLSLGDNCWRNINSFPLMPLSSQHNNGVHLSGTVSWLAIQNHFKQFVIVSLDLSTETYAQFLLPSGLDEAWDDQPTLQVLMDYLCFSYDDVETFKFVIWQMKEFGVQESWTQLFRIDFFNLKVRGHPVLFPLYLSKNGDTLRLTYDKSDQIIIYNLREDRVVEKIRGMIYYYRGENRVVRRNCSKVCPFSHGESLVWIH